MKCSRMSKNYGDVIRYYFLGRPFNCTPEMFDKEYNTEGYTPESMARECEHFTTEKLFKDFYGGITHWYKEKDGELIPWDIDGTKLIWFERGFETAIKAIGGLPDTFIKKCENCRYSNNHFVNKCEKKELCERWALDYQRAFDNLFYGNLCDSCVVQCNDKRTIWSDHPKTGCKNWKLPKEQ